MTPAPVSAQPSCITRLGAAGTLILGAAGTLSAASGANGTVLFNDDPGISAAELTPKGTHNLVYFDVTGDGTNDFMIDSARVGKSKGILAADLSAPVYTYLNEGDPLAFGSMVGPDTNFLDFTGEPGDTSVTSANLPAGQSYYGFSFTDGSTDYGWIQVSYISKKVTVLGWAFDTSGAPIAVGSIMSSIPEPSTTVLSMGAAALLAGSAAAWRRRKGRLPVAA